MFEEFDRFFNFLLKLLNLPLENQGYLLRLTTDDITQRRVLVLFGIAWYYFVIFGIIWYYLVLFGN